MKRRRLIAASLVCTVILAAACVYFLITSNHNYSVRCMKLIHVELPKESQVVVEKDEHDNFHGDGEYYSEIHLTQQGAREFISKAKQTSEWHTLPLSSAVQEIIYGDYVMGKICKVPPMKNGYYFVKDRYAQNYPEERNIGILSRCAINITIAMLNTDTSMLYIYKLDT